MRASALLWPRGAVVAAWAGIGEILEYHSSCPCRHPHPSSSVTSPPWTDAEKGFFFFGMGPGSEPPGEQWAAEMLGYDVISAFAEIRPAAP